MSTQQERDHNNLVRDTRAHLGSIIDELQRRYSRVDGTEASLDEDHTLVGAIIETCGVLAMHGKGDAQKMLTSDGDTLGAAMSETIERYCK